MILRFAAMSAVTYALTATAWAGERDVSFKMNPQFLTLPPCMQTIGDSHGDIAV